MTTTQAVPAPLAVLRAYNAAHAHEAIVALEWDEPPGALSARGWLMHGGSCVGFYLDYEPDHYRTGHMTDIGGGRVVSFCRPDHLCSECQPGNILVCRYWPGERKASRYVVTVADAKRWVLTGEL